MITAEGDVGFGYTDLTIIDVLKQTKRHIMPEIMMEPGFYVITDIACGQTSLVHHRL